MALIVEDGSIVAGANSYVTDLEFTDYCDSRGYTYPATVTEREILLFKAMDYIISVESKMKGDRVSETQPLSFPRYAVEMYGYQIDSDAIPDNLKTAQMELAIQANSEDLLINESVGSANGVLSSFNVQGVYSETYDTGGGRVGTVVKTGKANAYLKELLKPINRVIRA